MGFQTSVNLTSPVGTEGAKASSNPLAMVIGPAGGFVADSVNGLNVARFAWVGSDSKTLTNYAPGGVPSVPDGWVLNEFQANSSNLLSPNGINQLGGDAAIFNRGDFWARCGFQSATRGNKVFANLFSGAVIPGAAGSFPNYPSGVASTFQATFANLVMTVTSLTTGYIGIGHLVTGLGIPANTRVVSQDSGTQGGAGTYNLSSPTVTAITIGTAEACASTPADSIGGATVTATFATNVMTVTAVTDGTLVPGQLLTDSTSGLAAGTYIVNQLTGTTGGVGTYTVSTTPGTLASGTVNASAWIETPFFFQTPANVGELAIIGTRN